MRTKRLDSGQDHFPILRVTGPVQRLVLVLGDQLDPNASALTQLDKARDAIVMFDVAAESTHVPSYKQRTALFLSAMRHFALGLQRDAYRVHYTALDDPENTQALGSDLQRAIRIFKPKALVCTHPGEWRVNELSTGMPGAGP